MARIKTLEPLVYAALEEKPATRSDDFLLILEVLKHFVETDERLEIVLQHHKELCLPSFASIIRIRRILQLKHPHLVDKEMQEIRKSEEAEFKDYARDNK